MTTTFLQLTERLPSVQSFAKRVLKDITQQRSVVVFLPATISPDWIWTLLEGELGRLAFSWESIDVVKLAIADGPAGAVGWTLSASWPAMSTSRDVAALLVSENLPDVIVLDGIERADQPTRLAWVRFVDQWAQVSQNLPTRSTRYPVLCVLVQSASSETASLKSNVLLGMHWWWGFPSTLEVRLLCRLASDGIAGNDAQARWREHLLSTLVGGDVGLLESLWNADASDFEQIKSLARIYAEDRGWTRDRLLTWGVPDGTGSTSLSVGRISEQPASQHHAMWAQGVLQATPEHGVELHPAVLVVLDQQSELQHRLWRGQAELLLPVIDSIRLAICSHLTRRYGQDWPVRWHQPDHADENAAVRETPLACGWGYLEWLVRNCRSFEKERRWLDLIVPAVKVRNALAHYRVVTCDQYEQVQKQYQRFHKLTNL
jgi:hypothetical protein